MTRDEFLSNMKSRGAIIDEPADTRTIMIANSTLQAMRIAMLPPAFINLYAATNGMNMGAGYIFGPGEWTKNRQMPIPSIATINREIAAFVELNGKTIFGRNDLFLFAFDAFGACYMLDNTNLQTLRKYDNAHQAMTDCLLGGNF